jgi:hypothetical protein
MKHPYANSAGLNKSQVPKLTETRANHPGLCADCTHARQITSDRTSTFLQCQLSFTDPQFPKYPRLPVLACSGYKQQAVAGSTDH